MKERPIIFSTEMVRAILEGRKTQTRRVITSKRKLFNNAPNEWVISHIEMGNEWEFKDIKTLADYHILCPYGQVGDRLWVKETFQTLGSKKNTVYRATGGAELTWNINGTTHRETLKKWRSPLFMPRWASRITLEITGLRVERLQDISSPDIHAEGLPIIANSATPLLWYREIWDKLNAKRGYAWKSNPWVWVIEFKRLSD